MAFRYSLESSKVRAVLPTVEKYSKMYDVPVPLILAVIEYESNFDPKAWNGYSSIESKALGLMQLKPKYFKGNLYDINTNIKTGVKYLDTIKRHYFPYSMALQLAAYRDGPSGTKKCIAKTGRLCDSGKNYAVHVLSRLPYWIGLYNRRNVAKQLAIVAAATAVFGLIFWLDTKN